MQIPRNAMLLRVFIGEDDNADVRSTKQSS
jgi:hypothetical protein